MNVGLLDLLLRFLDHKTGYEKERSESSHVAKAVGSVKNSVKSVGHAVTSVPGTLFHTVENVADGLAKALTVKTPPPPFLQSC